MKIKFDKLYRYDRIQEPCSIAIPFAKGQVKRAEDVMLFDEGRQICVQSKVTSRYTDGSIRYLFVRFMTDLPGNKGKELEYYIVENDGNDNRMPACESGQIMLEESAGGFMIGTGPLIFTLENNSSHMFGMLRDESRIFTAEQFEGPYLSVSGERYGVQFGHWHAVEKGPLATVLECEGRCIGSRDIRFTCKITAHAGKSWLDVSVCLINTTENALHIESLILAVHNRPHQEYRPVIAVDNEASHLDSTGTGEWVNKKNGTNEGPIHTTGTKELDAISSRIGLEKPRTCVGISNYKTRFTIGKGEPVSVTADAKLLIGEANEHFAEVLYGTFFADTTDKNGGVCATIFQAQQNYPKAVTADENSVYLMLVPEGIDRVVMQSGMAREQRFLLHFHDAEESIAELDNRSLIYQMPDVPHLLPSAFKEAGVMPDIFVDPDKIDCDAEIALIDKADGHARCYGMMNWGDAPDPGYTAQGRGNGMPVWTNNEYDYPHSMYLMYARTGVRRFLDYANVAASHWMDVDVCHFSKNPLEIGGQWEHTRGHCVDGVMVCSHEWVEGLIDCYHFTGNERALETALGIGENILRLLETPMYQKSGESNARETGWALRTLTALYVETGDEKWVAKCQWIVGHFEEWSREYGEWVAPYTDNTMVRVGFMISVAVGSLMRYYRVFPQDSLRQLILSAVDDLVENCYLDNGLFYYKELPSLARNGNNTLLLEAMAIGYELTKDVKYLKCGMKTFEKAVHAKAGSLVGNKRIIEDTVISGSEGTKTFAQCFLPMTLFYKAAVDAKLI